MSTALPMTEMPISGQVMANDYTVTKAASWRVVSVSSVLSVTNPSVVKSVSADEDDGNAYAHASRDE